MVISQLESDGVPLPSEPPKHTPANESEPAPSKEEVRITSYEERSKCLKQPSEKSGCFPPIPNCEGDKDKGKHAAQSVQQGARMMKGNG